MTDLGKRSRNELLLCPSQLSWWARWQHRAENRSRRESCDLLPNVPRCQNVTKIPVWPAKKWTARQILYISKCRPHLGPNPGIVDPEVKLWGKSRCGSNRGCAGNTRCSLAGRRSAVTLHWPSCSSPNVAAHEIWRLDGPAWYLYNQINNIHRGNDGYVVHWCAFQHCRNDSSSRNQLLLARSGWGLM